MRSNNPNHAFFLFRTRKSKLSFSKMTRVSPSPTRRIGDLSAQNFRFPGSAWRSPAKSCVSSFTWLPKFAPVSHNNSVSHRASSFASCKLLLLYGMDRIRGFGGCELPFLPLFTISSRSTCLYLSSPSSPSSPTFIRFSPFHPRQNGKQCPE